MTVTQRPGRTRRHRSGGVLAAVALLAGAIAPAALISATSSVASADATHIINGDFPAGGPKIIDTGGIAPRSAFGGHVVHGIPNIDSIPNFSDHFNVKGLNGTGQVQNQWLDNFVGHLPQLGGTTTINAPIIPVSLNLLNPDGTTFQYVDATQFTSKFVNSPNFQNSTYSSSSTPTQIQDAIQRSEFASTAKPDWHTMLAADPKAGVVMNVPFGDWFIRHLNRCGCNLNEIDVTAFLNLFFNTIVDAINGGVITPQDISTFMFPDTYLFFNGDPAQCCVLGFHTYVFDDQAVPGKEVRWVINYSSWISPNIFRGGVQDVTANSHELGETFNDPFVVSDGIHGLTPWWQAPNGNCQNDMETGDVVEGLPNDVFPVTINGFTYHPQNEALLQWFITGTPSNALHGAFSYPDESVLPTAATFQNVNCTP